MPKRATRETSLEMNMGTHANLALQSELTAVRAAQSSSKKWEIHPEQKSLVCMEHIVTKFIRWSSGYGYISSNACDSKSMLSKHPSFVKCKIYWFAPRTQFQNRIYTFWTQLFKLRIVHFCKSRTVASGKYVSSVNLQPERQLKKNFMVFISWSVANIEIFHPKVKVLLNKVKDPTLFRRWMPLDVSMLPRSSTGDSMHRAVHDSSSVF